MIGHDLCPEWCDPVAVLRALDGTPVGRPLHHAEQVAVARAARSARKGARWEILMKAVGCNSTKAAALFEEAGRPRHAARGCSGCPSPAVCSLNGCWRFR